MGLFDRAKEAVSDGVDQAQDTASDVGDEIDNSVDNTFDRAQDTVDDIGQTVDETADQAADAGSDVAESVDDTVDNTVDKAQDTASDVGDSIDNAVDNTSDRVSDTTDDIGDKIDQIGSDSNSSSTSGTSNDGTGGGSNDASNGGSNDRSDDTNKPSSVREEKKSRQQAAEEKRPDLRDSTVEQSIRQQVANETGADPSTVEVNRQDGQYVAQADDYQAEVSDDAIRNQLLDRASQDSRYDRDDLSVRDVDAGFQIGVTEEARRDLRTSSQSQQKYQEGAQTTIDGVDYVVENGELERAESTTSISVDDPIQGDSDGLPQRSDPAGQETATGLGRGDLPQTGLQEFLAPIQESGREYNRREGEQFGDWDWSIGPADDLEKGARDFQEDVTDTAGNVGEAVGSNTGVPGALEAAGYEEKADRVDRKVGSLGRGVGEGAGGLVAGLPVMGMEAAETAGYAATNPKDAARKAPKALAGTGVATSRQIKENPARTIGALTSETLLTAGAGAGAARGARALVRNRRRKANTPEIPSVRGDGGARRPRTLAGDDRGQMVLGDLDPNKKRGGGSSSSPSSGGGGDSILPDNIEELKMQVENANSRRDANQRVEQRILEKRLEEGRRQERGDEPRTVDTRPGGDYTSPTRGGDYVASRSPDTSRSGPTSSQSASSLRSLDTDLSPRESQLASQLGRETPSVDIRGVDATRRSTPSTDLRVASRSSSSRIGAAGAAGGGAIPLLEQAQQSQVIVDDEGPSGVAEDTSIRGQSDAGDSLSLLDDAQSDSLGAEGSLEDWLSGLGVGTGTSTATGTTTGTTGTGTGTQSGVTTNTGTTVDTGTTTDSDSGTKTGGGTDTGGPGPVTPPPTSTTPETPVGYPPSAPPPTWDPPGGKPPRQDPPDRPEPEPDSGFALSLDTFSSGPTAPRETESDLQPGWLSETVTDLGTGGLSPSRSPSQQALESQPASLRATGQLPTQAMLSGNESVQEARSLLDPGIGDSGSGGFGFGFGFGSDSGEADSEPAFGLDLGFGSDSDDEEEGWFL